MVSVWCARIMLNPVEDRKVVRKNPDRIPFYHIFSTIVTVRWTHRCVYANALNFIPTTHFAHTNSIPIIFRVEEKIILDELRTNCNLLTFQFHVICVRLTPIRLFSKGDLCFQHFLIPNNVHEKITSSEKSVNKNTSCS